MSTDALTIRHHTVPALGTGESPVWHAGQQALYFVDIVAPALFRIDPETDTLRRWDMPSAIGSFGFCADDRMIVALRTGVHLFDRHTGSLEFVVDPEPDIPGNRLNDGKVGPDGCFWVGSMDDRPTKEPVAGLFRIAPDGSCLRILDDLVISNGLAWSPDGQTLYHSDTRQRFLQAFNVAADGVVSNRRVLRTFVNDDGRPDGGATDAEGCYWSAGPSAGCLNRIAPDGTLLQRMDLPVEAPTMPCFGGPDLKTLFVTSMTSNRSGTVQPGTLISFPVEVPGLAVGVFG